MADCEVCGDRAAVSIALIGGARMSACEDCSSFGKVIAPLVRPAAAKPAQRAAAEYEVVAGYGAKIKGARDQMKIGRPVLAELIAEKENYLERIEEERTLPSEPIARKLEKALGITLLELAQPATHLTPTGSGKGLTLGDMVTVKKRK